MKRVNLILVLGLILCAGCLSSSRKLIDPFLFEEPSFNLDEFEKKTQITAGLNMLEDKRPQTDVAYMASIREKVSEEVLKSLRGLSLFDEMHYPPTESDIILISGEVKRFSWESFDMMISYIPGLNILPFLGLPSTRTRSEVEIYLEFKNNKTKEVIFNLAESYKIDKKYSMYTFNPDKANKELAACFEMVLTRIKDKVFLNRNKILSFVASAVKDAPKPLKDLVPMNNSEAKENPREANTVTETK